MDQNTSQPYALQQHMDVQLMPINANGNCQTGNTYEAFSSANIFVAEHATSQMHRPFVSNISQMPLNVAQMPTNTNQESRATPRINSITGQVVASMPQNMKPPDMSRSLSRQMHSHMPNTPESLKPVFTDFSVPPPQLPSYFQPNMYLPSHAVNLNQSTSTLPRQNWNVAATFPKNNIPQTSSHTPPRNRTMENMNHSDGVLNSVFTSIEFSLSSSNDDAENFIKECQTGQKSDRRLQREKLIQSEIMKIQCASDKKYGPTRDRKAYNKPLPALKEVDAKYYQVNESTGVTSLTNDGLSICNEFERKLAMRADRRRTELNIEENEETDDANVTTDVDKICTSEEDDDEDTDSDTDSSITESASISEKMEESPYSSADSSTINQSQEMVKVASNSQEMAKAASDSQEMARADNDSQEIAKAASNNQEMAKAASDSQEMARADNDSQEIAKAASNNQEMAKAASNSQEMIKAASDDGNIVVSPKTEAIIPACSKRRETFKLHEKMNSHPLALHTDLWYNVPHETNDGPLCKCQKSARTSGIRHDVFVGEKDGVYPNCLLDSNNSDKLFYYKINIQPVVNFSVKFPTKIEFNDVMYSFNGFSVLSHFPLDRYPPFKIIRFNYTYTISYDKEEIPKNFSIRELQLFHKYLFHDLLDLKDFNPYMPGSKKNASCPIFHFIPLFIHHSSGRKKEILPMARILEYLIRSNKPVIPDPDKVYDCASWKYNVLYPIKETIITKPAYKPSAIRVDGLERANGKVNIIHSGVKPLQMMRNVNRTLNKLYRRIQKLRHLVANQPKPCPSLRARLREMEDTMHKIRMTSKSLRSVTVSVPCEGFYATGIKPDVVQHALILPALTCHLRFHRSLEYFEQSINYSFSERRLLQMAFTHPSYREYYGTNADHVRNTLSNCGLNHPEYGNKSCHISENKKRGIETLIQIMALSGSENESASRVTHNERLEFLGDAVLEFIATKHLYFLFQEIEEGGLATYRSALVQNQNLANIGDKLNLGAYMLYAHGADLCHREELRHAIANCFEALMGAMYLDSNLNVADKFYSFGLSKVMPNAALIQKWDNIPKHHLQIQEPDGDRHFIPQFPLLRRMAELEEKLGVHFNHIRLLARAFVDRSIGINTLTLGTNQRMEFLGDSILQLICSSHLYRHFPEHHEGHMSLLRSTLVNNKMQAEICEELHLYDYLDRSNDKTTRRIKDKADLLEAFIGALYVDQGMDACQCFVEATFFPRILESIMSQNWNDPKSKLQQCCLTVRELEGKDPDIPIYKVISCRGPTNSRSYTVSVSFKGERLATAEGNTVQMAEMNAAAKALINCKDLFPQLKYQKNMIKKHFGTPYLIERWKSKICPRKSSCRSKKTKQL